MVLADDMPGFHVYLQNCAELLQSQFLEGMLMIFEGIFKGHFLLQKKPKNNNNNNNKKTNKKKQQQKNKTISEYDIMRL